MQREQRLPVETFADLPLVHQPFFEVAALPRRSDEELMVSANANGLRTDIDGHLRRERMRTALPNHLRATTRLAGAVGLSG